MRPEGDPRRYESGCLGKIQFPSEGAALGFLAAGRKPQSKRKRVMTFHEGPEGLAVYPCPFSTPGEPPHWHTGHE